MHLQICAMTAQPVTTSYNKMIQYTIRQFKSAPCTHTVSRSSPPPVCMTGNEYVMGEYVCSCFLCSHSSLFGRTPVTTVLPDLVLTYLCHCCPCRHQDVDIAIIRENTEGEYSGLEHEVCVVLPCLLTSPFASLLTRFHPFCFYCDLVSYSAVVVPGVVLWRCVMPWV